MALGIKGRKAIVCASSRGLGRACAEALAQNGCEVVINGRDAARLEVGTAWVNHHRATSATVPFGGAKESGVGRVYSEMGLKAYLEPRVVSVLKGA